MARAATTDGQGNTKGTKSGRSGAARQRRAAFRCRHLRHERLEERVVLSAGPIAGSVFHDLNGNGAQEVGEVGIGGATVFLDANRNGLLNGGETSTATLADGSYEFAGLAPGDYTVAQVLPDGWLQTAAGSPGLGRAGEATRRLTPAGTGNPLSIAWVDGTIYQVDSVNNVRKIWQVDPLSGAATFAFDAPGHTYFLAYDGANLWGTDSTNDKIYHFTTDGTLLHTFNANSANVSGIAWDGESLWVNDYGTKTISRLDVGDLSGTQLTVLDSIVAVPEYGGQPRGLAFDGQHLWMSDASSDAIYQIDRATGAVVQTIDPPLVSESNSNPTGLTFDGHMLWYTEWPAERWLRQLDPGGDHRDVTVLDGQTSTAAAVGNFQMTAISGTVFLDSNQNGVQNVGEAGLAFRQVFLDEDGDGQVDAGEAATTTDVAGNYALLGRIGGAYSVSQILPSAQWVQVAPAAPYSVTVTTSGQVAAGQHFADYVPGGVATKFFVVNDGSPDRTYEYATNGAGIENYGLASGNTAPRGAAATAAGDKVWVVDANKVVYVYNDAGALLGSWQAANPYNSQFEGITVHGNDIWMVDTKYDFVRYYRDVADDRVGFNNPTSGFALNSGNKDAKDLVTDGTHIWVVNDAATNKVFKYTMAGALVGSWTIAAPNATPTGITLDPTGASNDLWIVDSGTDKVYQYADGKAWTSGTRSASATFNLAAGNTNPQGIADPPVGGAMLVAMPVEVAASDGADVSEKGVAASTMSSAAAAIRQVLDRTVFVEQLAQTNKLPAGRLRGEPAASIAVGYSPDDRSERLAAAPRNELPETALLAGGNGVSHGNRIAAYDAVFGLPHDFLLDGLLANLAAR